MDDDHRCSKCGGNMELGFTLDSDRGSYLPTLWIQGRPERSFWTVTKIGGKTKRRVDSYRCTDCGFLESYAVDEWSLKFPN